MAYTADQILALAAAYRDATGLSYSTIGRRLCGNYNFLNRLTLGQGISTKTLDRASESFVANWPAGAPWPLDTPRPPTVEAAE